MIWRFLAYIAVFFAEALTAWIYLGYLFSRKTTLIRCIGSFVVGYTLLLCLIPLNSTLVNSLAFAAVNGTVILLNYSCSKAKALINAGFLAFVMLFSEIATMLLLNLFVHDFQAYSYKPTVWVALAVISKLVYFFVVLVVAKIFSTKERYRSEEPGGFLLLCVLPLVSIVIVATLFYVGMFVRKDPFLEVLMLISMILLLLLNFLVLIIYRQVQRLAEERAEMEVALEREKAQLEYDSIIKEQFELQRELVHDIRHHVQTLSDLGTKQDGSALLQYARQIEEDPALASRVVFCSNPVINVIIVRYADECRKEGIDFDCDIREGCLEMVLPKDASTIFHNLLSNAIEAAAQSRNKRLELSVFYRKEQSTDVIAIINSYGTAPVESPDGFYYSSKLDPKRHGIGLRSVSRVVTKYRGALSFHYNDGEKLFYTTVSLPREQNLES